MVQGVILGRATQELWHASHTPPANLEGEAPPQTPSSPAEVKNGWVGWGSTSRVLNVLYYFMTGVRDHVPCAEGAVQFCIWARTTTAMPATTTEEFSQSIQAPSSTHPGTTYPVRAHPSLRYRRFKESISAIL